MKKLFIVAALAVVCSSASAQFVSSKSSTGSASTVNTDGWSTVYLQYNPMTFDMDGTSEDFTGFTLGYNRAISVSSSTPIYVEVGGALQYAYYSDDYDDDYDIEYKYSVWSIKVPVSILYDWQVSNSVSILPFVGLTFRYNVSGKYKIDYDGDDYDWNLFDDDDMEELGWDEAWKRFQMGWQIGVNAKFNKFLVGVSYGSDFSEIYDECKFKTTSITVGYSF